MAEVTEQGLIMRYTVEKNVDVTPLEQAQAGLEMAWEGTTLIVRGSGSWTAPTINAAVVPFLFHVSAGLLEIRRGKSLEDAYRQIHSEADG